MLLLPGMVKDLQSEIGEAEENESQLLQNEIKNSVHQMWKRGEPWRFLRD